MRRYVDPDGRTWDVVVGRESWGALYALFVPAGRERDEPVRQAMLDAEDYNSAHVLLADLPDGDLAALFRRSSPKNT